MIRRLGAILLLCCLAGTSWAGPHFQEQLVSDNGGLGVDMDGEWMAVGQAEICTVFVYRFDYQTKWWGDGGLGGAPPVAGAPRQEIEPPQGACPSTLTRGYGEVVSVNGRLLIVGAPEAKGPKGILRDGEALAAESGTVFVYLLDEASGMFNLVVQSLEAESPDGILRVSNGARYGAALAVNEDLITIGAPSEGTLASPNGGRGEMYFYRFDFTTHSVINLGFLLGAAPGDQFGFAVTVDAPRVLIGVPGSDLGGVADAGAAFLYEVHADNSITLIEQITVDPFPPQEDNRSGSELSMSPELMLLAGAPASLGGGVGGTAYPLEPAGSSFTPKFEYDRSAGGDVSQSEGVAGFGIAEIGVDIYPDVLNDNGDQRSNYHLEVDLTGPGTLVANGEPTVTPFGAPIPFMAEDIRMYKDTVLVSDLANDQIRSLVFPCGYGAELKAFEWSLVSIPCELPPGTTVEAAFNADIFPGACDPECGALGVYGPDWEVWGQDGDYTSARAARRFTADDVIESGKGYWLITNARLKPPGQPVYWNVDVDTSIAYTPIINVGGLLFPQPANVAGYHEQPFPIGELAEDDDARIMVGNPFPRAFNWSNVRVRVLGFPAPVALAEVLYPIVGMGNAYLYNPTITEGQPYDVISTTPGFPTLIPPNTGFWVSLPPALLRPTSILLPLEK